jgi:hypothetical protein
VPQSPSASSSSSANNPLGETLDARGSNTAVPESPSASSSSANNLLGEMPGNTAVPEPPSGARSVLNAVKVEGTTAKVKLALYQGINPNAHPFLSGTTKNAAKDPRELVGAEELEGTVGSSYVTKVMGKGRVSMFSRVTMRRTKTHYHISVDLAMSTQLSETDRVKLNISDSASFVLGCAGSSAGLALLCGSHNFEDLHLISVLDVIRAPEESTPYPKGYSKRAAAKVMMQQLEKLSAGKGTKVAPGVKAEQPPSLKRTSIGLASSDSDYPAASHLTPQTGDKLKGECAAGARRKTPIVETGDKMRKAAVPTTGKRKSGKMNKKDSNVKSKPDDEPDDELEDKLEDEHDVKPDDKPEKKVSAHMRSKPKQDKDKLIDVDKYDNEEYTRWMASKPKTLPRG